MARVFVIGGESMEHTLGSCSIFDTSNFSITQTHAHSFTKAGLVGSSRPGITPRTKFGFCITTAGRVYICGGEGEDASALASVEYMDLRDMLWRSAPDLQHARIGCAAAGIVFAAIIVGRVSHDLIIGRCIDLLFAFAFAFIIYLFVCFCNFSGTLFEHFLNLFLVCF
jgi:hypothetical protein